jgi:tRNA (guanosine-2'-O-)-methyltransferase
MTPERYQKLRRTLDLRQPDLTLLTDQIHKPRNIAALVRTSDAVGVHELNMVWRKEQHRPYSGTAMGSDRWVDIVRHESMVSAIDTLHAQNYQIYAAHLSSEAVDYRSVDYTKPCAILIGNEKKGVSKLAAEKADKHIVIPMMGMVESFNVSVAAAIILAEAQLQRQCAGCYDKVGLSQEAYKATFFRWAHPHIAKYCQDKKLPYPEVRESDGEIIDPSAWYKNIRVMS